MSVHRRTLGEWIYGLFNRPYRQVNTGWMRKPVEQPVAKAPVQQPVVQPTTTVYPILQPRPYANGDSVRTYRHSHPVEPTVAPKVVHLTELPREQYWQATSGMSAAAIQAARTIKQLSTDMLPPHVSGQIPVSSGMLPENKAIMERARQHALGHSTHIEPVAPEQVSQSLWIEQQASVFPGSPNSHTSPLHGSWNAEEQAPSVQQPVASPEWLVEEPTLPTRRDSSYLLCQTPTLYFWEEFTQLATQQKSEEETPTAQVPSVMRQRVTQRYNKESE